MKFTKTAVAVAIAGIVAAPMIASADTTLSGAVQIQLDGTDGDGDDADPTINADDVLFGIVAEHELNSGLTGYGSLRVDMNRLSNAGTEVIEGDPATEDDDIRLGSAGTADSVYVGVKGGFGDIRFGEIPLAVEYGQVANDIFDVGGEINGGLSYVGTFGPVGLIANVSPEQNSDAAGLGAKFGLGGFSIGLGAEQRGADDLVNGAAGVSFAFAGASIAAHFWSQEVAEGAGDGDLESMSVKVGYGFGGVSADLTFSTLQDDGATDEEAIRLDLVYGLGGGMDISTRITAASDNNDTDADETSWRLKLSKSF